MRYAGFECPKILNARFRPLTPVFKVLFQPIHAFFDIFQGIGVGKS
jgi:hypothetical protein